eukprot:evm.model.scf_1340.3 EVM.evm.TU.scf_1340.3   scf_1340:25578-28090(-)
MSLALGGAPLQGALSRQCCGGCEQRAARAPRPRGPRPPRAEGTSQPEAPDAAAATGWLWELDASATPASLREQRIRPKRSLGQNFVTDDGVLAAVVAATGVSPGEPVVELGPGTGNLTRHLLGAGALVTAVEKDDALQAKLRENFRDVPELTIVHGDVLEIDVRHLVSEVLQRSEALTGRPSPVHRVKMVANLPYNITTECLKLILPMADCISSFDIMIQDEAARRFTLETPGDATYRAMTIYAQYYANPRYEFRVDRRKYFPAPKVDGAFVRFPLKLPEERLDVGDERGFFILVIRTRPEWAQGNAGGPSNLGHILCDTYSDTCQNI